MWSLIPSRAQRKAVSLRPSPTLFFCVAGAFLLTLLPHLPQLPLWVTGGILGAMILRSVIEVRRWPLPSSAFCGVLALCLVGGIYFQFNTIFGRDAGTAFMVTLVAVKFFELRGPRDIALIIFCSFFVTMSSLLYSQAMELFIYCLLMMWVLTALLLRTSMGDMPENRLLRMLRSSAFIFLQALPLTLFLFFFFPRYHGVLQLGLGDSSVGLTDRVEPGSISRLAEDDSTAFTAKLTGEGLPTTDTMYWRALVLWTYDNGAWVPGPGAFAPKNRSDALPEAAPGSATVSQEITVWPHFHRWLFALDYPVTLAENRPGSVGWSEALNGNVLSLSGSGGILTRKERYTVTSASRIAPQQLRPELRKAGLQLPPQQIDPRVQALALRLQQGCVTEDDYIRSVLHYFRHGGFIYSESPGAHGKDALADFLLKSKTGFCEHYASSFAVLMRLGGYPTRLVVGYHGAQFNPYKNIFVIKQYNAHTWDEVWFDSEKQWRRLDPTAILSSRATLADANASDAASGLSIEIARHSLPFLPKGYMPQWMQRGLLEVQLRRDEIEADWNDWIFSYDPDAQGRLAAALGLGEEARYALGLACVAAFVLCGLVFGLTMARRPAVTPVENFYAKFCRGMARRGVPRETWEGPLAYTRRVAQNFPAQQQPIDQAGLIVTQARYGTVAPAATHDELKALLLAILRPTEAPAE